MYEKQHREYLILVKYNHSTHHCNDHVTKAEEVHSNERK